VGIFPMRLDCRVDLAVGQDHTAALDVGIEIPADQLQFSKRPALVTR
jgi:hypothetical protein